ncbi:permease [Chryseobacterium sp. Leaf404]|uniref:ABC transporter permease n=1 Tax=unclassified Chryseobacterium TaxID=2593645 RepID=UPI0006F4CE9D|nr:MULTISPECIES: ABC transporter permease [unclassified Chryseobacterium]KQT16077.1 permease [Chryseobacterium sp. Leaf404]
MKNIAFYIASRYLISKKGSTAVTFITWLAVGAMGVAVTAMFVIISVFSGLEDFNEDLVKDLHADITIKSKIGKTIKNTSEISEILKKNKEIAHFSRVIEEKVYINFDGKGDIAYLRGVDSVYAQVNPLHRSIILGTYPDFRFNDEVLIENSLDLRLSIPVNSDKDLATLYMPKPGKGLINREEDIYNRKNIFITGVFNGKDQLNSYIIAPIALSEELLNLPKNSAYNIVIKLKNPDDVNEVRRELQKSLGKDVILSTKTEENSAFWKMINTEKLFIYLIFGLVIFITTFNLAGAIIILQLDKREQARSLVSLGFPLSHLRKTYFYTGILIVSAGIISGLVIGTSLCLFQEYTGLFKVVENLPFPVRIEWKNYVIVSATAAGFGILISWIFSKISKGYITKS